MQDSGNFHELAIKIALLSITRWSNIKYSRLVLFSKIIVLINYTQNILSRKEFGEISHSKLMIK